MLPITKIIVSHIQSLSKRFFLSKNFPKVAFVLFIGILSIWANGVVFSYKKIGGNPKNFLSSYTISNYDKVLKVFPISAKENQLEKAFFETSKINQFLTENGLLEAQINFETTTSTEK